jgi:hypothetical protein
VTLGFSNPNVQGAKLFIAGTNAGSIFGNLRLMEASSFERSAFMDQLSLFNDA